VGCPSNSNSDTGTVTMDEWQQLRFLAWPWIVGSAMVQAVYILLWLIADGHFSRRHQMACAVSGVTAGLLAFVITRYWNSNSSGYWAAFTMGLIVLAGISVTASSLMLLHATRHKK